MTSKDALIRLSKSAGAWALEFGDKMYDTDKEALAILKNDLDVKRLLQGVLAVWSRPQLGKDGKLFEEYLGVVLGEQHFTQSQLKQIKDWLEGK